MCREFRITPSVLDQEECPRIFTMWDRIMKMRAEEAKADKKWTVLISPLYQTPLVKEHSEYQSELRRDLLDSLESEEDIRERRELMSKQAEEQLKLLGVNVVKRG